MRKVVVLDVAGPLGRENKLFDRKNIGNNRHGWAMCHLYEECKKEGIDLITADRYLAQPTEFPGSILWRNATLGSSADQVIAAGAHPAILMGFEHPLYACRFYWNLAKLTAPYDYTLMPKGAESFASPRTKFRSFISPQPYAKGTEVPGGFSKRKFLTMISGNARVHPLRRAYVTIAHAIHPLPTFENRELYIDRLDAIRHFAKREGFDLYGVGWDMPIRFSWGRRGREWRRAVGIAWRGAIDDKYPVLQQYKFSICFENCIFGGWVTEKIIDSMAAGCIPVYWGAPDITDYIPSSCFIDFRKFQNWEDLERFLSSMDEETYNGYIRNINTFMASEAFARFTQEQFAADMIGLFNEYFKNT